MDNNQNTRTALEYDISKESENTILETVRLLEEELNYTVTPNYEGISGVEYYSSLEETPSVVKAQHEGESVSAYLNGDTLTVLPSDDDDLDEFEEKFNEKFGTDPR